MSTGRESKSLTFPSSCDVRCISYRAICKVRRPFFRHKLLCTLLVSSPVRSGNGFLRVRVKVENGMTGIM